MKVEVVLKCRVYYALYYLEVECTGKLDIVYFENIKIIINVKW